MRLVRQLLEENPSFHGSSFVSFRGEVNKIQLQKNIPPKRKRWFVGRIRPRLFHVVCDFWLKTIERFKSAVEIALVFSKKMPLSHFLGKQCFAVFSYPKNVSNSRTQANVIEIFRTISTASRGAWRHQPQAEAAPFNGNYVGFLAIPALSLSLGRVPRSWKTCYKKLNLADCVICIL